MIQTKDQIITKPRPAWPLGWKIGLVDLLIVPLVFVLGFLGLPVGLLSIIAAIGHPLTMLILLLFANTRDVPFPLVVGAILSDSLLYGLSIPYVIRKMRLRHR